MGIVAFGQYPGLEGKSRGIGAEHDEVVRLGYQARAAAQLLADDVAKDAALFEIEVGSGSLDLLANALGNHRERDQLRMAVLQGGASRLAMVLEQDGVAQALVLLEV